jgi:hypothetical protein
MCCGEDHPPRWACASPAAGSLGKPLRMSESMSCAIPSFNAATSRSYCSSSDWNSQSSSNTSLSSYLAWPYASRVTVSTGSNIPSPTDDGAEYGLPPPLLNELSLPVGSMGKDQK